MSLWVSVLSYVAALLGVALVALYMFVGRRHSHWRKKGVKHLQPLPFIGNMQDMVLARKNIGFIFKDIYDQHKKEPYIGLYSFDEPVLQINDLDLIRAVLVKDFQYFCDRNFNVSEKIDKLGARNLFALKGDRWKHSRNAITPSFTSGKMKQMYGIIQEQAIKLSETLEKENKGQPITIYELAARYTTEVIASCAFGISSETLNDPNAEFRAIMRKAFEFNFIQGVKIMTAFMAPKLLELANIKVFKQEVEDFVINTIKTTIDTRKTHNIKRNDLLDCFIEIMKDTNLKSKVEMDEIDVAAHSMVFIGAGFETSATTISYSMYELAKHIDIQDRLREEIAAVWKEHGGTIPYDVLSSMKLLDMVMQETLRKYPPVPFLDRVSNSAYTLPGTDLTLEAGSVVIVPSLAIQRDPEIYPNPMEFIPERFSEENKANRPSCTHMPFGEGPRTCVGMRFAYLQTKLGMIYILKNHAVQLADSTPTELDFSPNSFLFQPREHVKLIFRNVESVK